MEIVKLNGRLTSDEKETVLTFDYSSHMWMMDTTILKHYNKAIRQGWQPIKQYIYEDGSICGGSFYAPDYAITIRSTLKKQLTDNQMCNLTCFTHKK